jgi:hypothetical protein
MVTGVNKTRCKGNIFRPEKNLQGRQIKAKMIE